MEGYPKVKYPEHSGGSIVVETPEQEKALGPGWVDHKPEPAPVITVDCDADGNAYKFKTEAELASEGLQIIRAEKKPRRKKEPPSLESN